LPTYDEVIGVNGITNENYNEFLLDQLRPGKLNVLTIHAEAEGITLAKTFENFLDDAMKQGWEIVPLGKLLPRDAAGIPTGEICKEVIPGREGWVSVQKS
jgi:undecaprenyl phosphate-alpha-L-ara4FN deformylase